MKEFADAAALRRSLEMRLKTRSQDAGLPLDRLRKEAALQRLLARIAAVAPEGSWALKDPGRDFDQHVRQVAL